MEETENYGKHRLKARTHTLKNSQGYRAEVFISRLDKGDIVETLFTLSENFPNEETAIAAALQVGRYKVRES